MSDQETQQPSGEERPPKSNRDELQPQRHGARDRGGRRRHQQPSQSPSTRRPEAAINMDELRELVELIAQHGFTDFELEREGIRVRLRRELAPQLGAPHAAAPLIAPVAAAAAQPASTQTPASSGSTDTGSAVAASTSAPPAGGEAQAGSAPGEEEGLHMITSPIVGTFYRAASPNSEPFVRLGSNVDPDMVVCIIEAMKLMNEIQAETDGEVVKIYVENGQPVEYGQPLFGIKK
jgi:acetyl-CoA carboxylase biotin carboxyl carrier protein